MRGADRGVVLGLHRSGPDRDLIEHALNLGVCGIDTAYNYRGFTSHRALAEVATDLLGEFTLSTKVGYFPSDSGGRSVHSLDPDRLREAIEQSGHELGRAPDVVFLHNPEATLSGHTAGAARDQLAAACAVLVEAVESGMCGSWGIATWDPRPVTTVIEQGTSGIQPDMLLLRAGLSVAEPILAAGETLCRTLDISAQHRWGMSPFNGSTLDPVWSTVDLTPFLATDRKVSTPQAAFRLAFELPTVTRVAVGTSNPEHLRNLANATELAVHNTAIHRYRELIKTA